MRHNLIDAEGFVKSNLTIQEVGGNGLPWPEEVAGEKEDVKQKTGAALSIDTLNTLDIEGIRFKIDATMISFSVDGNSYIIPYKKYNKSGKYHVGAKTSDKHIAGNLKGVDVNYDAAIRKLLELILNHLGKENQFKDYIEDNSYGDIKLGDLDESSSLRKRNIFINGVKYTIQDNLNSIVILPDSTEHQNIPDEFEHTPGIKKFLEFGATKRRPIMGFEGVEIDQDIRIYELVSKHLKAMEQSLKLAPKVIAGMQDFWRNWGFMHMYIRNWNKQQQTFSQS